MSDRMVCVASFWQVSDAQIARLRLAEEGIKVHLEGVETVDAISLWANATGGVKLYVLEGDAARAAEILGEQTPEADPANAATPEWVCPKCGELVAGGFSVCWACGTGADGTEDPEFQSFDDDLRDDGDDQEPDDGDEDGFAPAMSEAETIQMRDVATWKCPGCRRVVPVREASCPNCGTQQGRSINPFASPTQVMASAKPSAGKAHTLGSPGKLSSEGDDLAGQALVAAVVGLVFCPGLLHLTSLWSLGTIWFNDLPISAKGRRRALIAACIDIPVTLALLMFLSQLITSLVT